MEAGVTTTATTTASFSSILDKPLSQLTEEDISQLTREDCRKFLKEKGMRRPSWNKSQAIQQVISFKALLESNEDSGAGARRKILVCPPPSHFPPQNAVAPSNSGESVKEAVFGEEESLYGQKDLSLKAAPVVQMNCQGGDTDDKTLSPSLGSPREYSKLPGRSQCETNELGGQMTIFYCGKINVYDGVPLAKARAIMHLAASPIDFPQGNLCNQNGAFRSFLGHVQEAEDKNDLTSSIALNLNSHTMHTEKMTEYQQQFRGKANISRDSDVDGQVSRKESLQRYLEKRKDRGRFFKGRKNAGQALSSSEMYLNHQIRAHYLNGQTNQSRTSSPPQSGVPHAFYSSADNQELVNFSVDLNDEGGQEH
ncbi:protein TIFY 4B isoform X1 [Gossypium raimondii]|uniref:Protein TIFY n=1 Tax=Gossypium raimondii TaxID=29730 RepID=A0A0D2VN78_GOSRA|nr:protein TIFY 4B isoform X1 [Gossypium raimondii]KJB72290.1 hypothetical protein B456_011G168900 [Gossypium raimondii]